ncbi:MAG: hypothetical protein BWZ10_00147 [candidate division BRC1 bacterium ADurb.BinA364]|nr:MAG: hypothetical protein BWZ10_00147 [candidate division BRC1 bacterium ADurb.BinA364]
MQRIVGGQPHGFDLQRPRMIDRAREDAVARPFFHRHALSGHHRLIDRAVAARHNAIDGDAVARARQHLIANPQRLDGRFDSLAVAKPQRHRRRQFEQSLDRPSRAFRRIAFQSLAQRKQNDHDRRLGPFADGQRARHGDHHQRIDAQSSPQDGFAKRGPSHRPAPQGDGQPIQRVACRLAADPAVEQRQRQSGGRQDASRHCQRVFRLGEHEAPESGARRGRTRRFRGGQFEAGGADRFGQGAAIGRPRGGKNRQRARRMVHRARFDSIEFLDHIAQPRGASGAGHSIDGIGNGPIFPRGFVHSAVPAGKIAHTSKRHGNPRRRRAAAEPACSISAANRRYRAPRPLRIAQIVRQRIRASSQSDQLSI